jgi:hypothetical protein
MSRQARTILNSRSILTVLVGLCALLAIAPPSWVRWSDALANPGQTLLAPVRAPVNRLFSLSPMAGVDPRTIDAATIRQQCDEYLTALKRSEVENETLRQKIAELQRGIELNPGLALRQYTAQVIGHASDLSSDALNVRAGKRQGVEGRAVAVARGVHLVGRVASVQDRTCTVTAITDRSFSGLRGVVMVNDTLAGPECYLEKARRAGQLVFTLEDREITDPASGRPFIVGPGQTVRVKDPTWPMPAQMLIIGKVVSVEPKPESPLRRIVIVRPELDVTRVSELTLRWLADTQVPGTTGSGRGGAVP